MIPREQTQTAHDRITIAARRLGAVVATLRAMLAGELIAEWSLALALREQIASVTTELDLAREDLGQQPGTVQP